MSEEVQILLAAKGFHQLLADLLDALDEEWISQAQGRMWLGGNIDLAALSQTVFLEQFQFVLSLIQCRSRSCSPVA
jgi:hypothetical protein